MQIPFITTVSRRVSAPLSCLSWSICQFFLIIFHQTWVYLSVSTIWNKGELRHVAHLGCYFICSYLSRPREKHSPNKDFHSSTRRFAVADWGARSRVIKYTLYIYCGYKKRRDTPHYNPAVLLSTQHVKQRHHRTHLFPSAAFKAATCHKLLSLEPVKVSQSKQLSLVCSAFVRQDKETQMCRNKPPRARCIFQHCL